MDASPAPAELRGLLVQSGDSAGAWQPIRSPVTLVGRALGCDISLTGPTVRLLHCILAPDRDGIALRSIHTGGVKVNGRAATTVVLRDGDQFEIGGTQFRVRWPAIAPMFDPAIDALRIQTAALVAQQSAIFDRELRVHEREARLVQQEEQLGSHLEDKRRQLLELQDQITEAREDLRGRRAALEELAERQARELQTTRDRAADMLADAKAKRARIAKLQRRLWERWQRERQTQAETEADLVSRLEQLNDDRTAWRQEVAKHNGRVELDQRQLQDGWQRLNEERQEWQDRRTADLADLNRRLRDLAQRGKAVSAAEARHKSEKMKLERELGERRHEIEHLETRIGHARQRLLESQAAAVLSRPVATSDATVSISHSSPIAVNTDSRVHTLAQVACELADQRLWLCEQIARFNQARQLWLTEREKSASELDALAADLHDKEQKLSRRARDLSVAEQRTLAESHSLGHLRVQIEAERTKSDAAFSAQRCELNRQGKSLLADEQRLANREQQLHQLLILWGQRRRTEIERLRGETASCQAERGEWAAARDAWLREYEQIVGERRDLASRALALEQVRGDWLQAIDDKPLATKRLERLERQWATQLNADVRDLDRLRDTIESDSARLDELAERIRNDRLTAVELLTSTQEKVERLEADRAAFEAERLQIAESVEIEQAQRAAAETHVLGLRDEVESLARLLIDAPVPINRAA